MKTTREHVRSLLKAHRVELGGLYHKMSSRVSELNAEGGEQIEKRTRKGRRYKEYRLSRVDRPLDVSDTLC
jgi:hypothetical protein